MATSSNKIPNLANPFNILKLFTPIKNYHYFDQYSLFPFNTTAVTHDNNNAWWLAELSSLIYNNEAFVRQQLKQVFAIGDNNITWLCDPKTDTQGVILELDDCYIIAFRGTEFYTPRMLTFSRLRSTCNDLITDLKCSKITDSVNKDIAVHQGFHDALKEVWKTLKQVIDKNDKPLWLTGHSMGGAISTIAAIRLTHRVKALYSYGMPCVGGDELSTYCSQQFPDKIFRYVNENDFVVSVMPRFMSEYQHIGQEKPIKLKKHNSPFEFLGDAFKLDIIDHSPLFYMLGTRDVI